jgi:hypothetical protein
VGPIRLLADPDCVVCGLLAHIPASSRFPRPAAYHRPPAKMLIRPSASARTMALAGDIAAPPIPGSHDRRAQITQI